VIALFLRFRAFARPYRLKLVLALIATVVTVGLSLLEPWPIKVLVDSVLGTHPMPGWVPRWLAGGSDDTRIAALCALLLLIVAFEGLLDYAGTYLSEAVGQRMTFDIREAVHAHLHRLSLAYHHSQRPGDLASRLTSDVQRIQDVVISVLGTLVTSVLTLVGMFAVMLAVNWRFTLMALAISPLLFATIYVYTNRIKASARHARKQDGRVAAVVQESLSAIHLVQAYTREDYEFERFRREAEGSLRSSIQATMLQARFAPVVDFLTAISLVIVLWVGAHEVLAGSLTLGLLLVFMSYLRGLYRPMKALSKLSYVVSRGTASAERIIEVMDAAPSLPVSATPYAPERVRGAIEFDAVRFRYPLGSDAALRGVSFRAEPGQVLALVGRTGAGKSTIVSLIPRFYDVDDGAVRVDGVDVRAWDLAHLRNQVSLVLQDTWLFQASVHDNIAYGRPDATSAEVAEVARAALAHDFIAKLPDGYDTIVGPRGATLSGGERQRIAIARAMLRDAAILILDEPTTGLDPQSEELVLRALRRLMAHRTTLVITHGTAPLVGADAILAVDDGRIVRRLPTGRSGLGGGRRGRVVRRGIWSR
jgi:subfamily B ATP-binding cassette protein MsbA